MQSRLRLRTIALLVGLVALLVVVAIASRAGHAPGSTGQLLRLSPTAFDYVLTVMVVLGSALLVALVRAALLAYRSSFRAMDFRDRGHASLFRSMAGIVAFTLIVALFLKVMGTTHNKTFLKLLQPRGASGHLPPQQGIPHAVEFRWQGALIAVAVILGVMAVYILRRRGPELRPLVPPGRLARHPRTDDAAEARSDLLDAFDNSLEDLYKEPDARRAVIAAYARAEHVLAEHGFGRRPSETPFEYLRRVLSEVRVRPQAALELADLFERAKFSRREIDHRMRQDAVAALQAVRDDLGLAT